jgi:hypothetical protein
MPIWICALALGIWLVTVSSAAVARRALSVCKGNPYKNLCDFVKIRGNRLNIRRNRQG